MSGRHSFPAKQTPNKGDYICQSAAIRYKYSCVFTAAAAVFFIIYLGVALFPGYWEMLGGATEEWIDGINRKILVM